MDVTLCTKVYEGWSSSLPALFRKTTTRNKELEARVEDLERELNVWKIAQKAADEEKSVLNKKVYKLERSIGSIKVRRHLA